MKGLRHGGADVDAYAIIAVTVLPYRQGGQHG
jgi:hypothetical protein